MFKISPKNLILFLRGRSLSLSTLRREPPESLSSSSSLLLDRLVKSLGIPFESAVSIAEKFGKSNRAIEKCESVLSSLESWGFHKAQIGTLVTKKPWLLRVKAEWTINPKLQFLRDSGLTERVSCHLMAHNPLLFCSGLDSTLKPRMSFLRKYIPSANALNNAIRRTAWLLTVDHRRRLEPNINLLTSKGVTAYHVSQMIERQPRSLMLKIGRLSSIVEAVNGLGIRPTSATFWVAVGVLAQMKASTLQKKVELFESLGCSQQDVLSMFVRRPGCLACSEENIRRTVDFYVNAASIPLEYIPRNPLYLMFSVDRRLLPRHRVITALRSEGILKKEQKYATLFKLSDKDFSEQYVIKHLDRVPHLMEIYRGSVMSETNT